MIVVSDTSPLNYLLLIDAVEILPQLFQRVYVPVQVLRELQHMKTPEVVRRWAANPPQWLEIATPKNAFAPAAALDPGEAQALALAKELDAKAVLIDEKQGRRIAKEEGFTIIGTLTLLELAAEARLIHFETAVKALKQTSFRISDLLINEALARHGALRRGGGR